MKLMICLECNSVFNLKIDRYQSCDCGHSGGVYVNEVDASVHGSREKTFVLGFKNSSLASALRAQRDFGDLPATMAYLGKIVSPGRNFESFVIPESSPSIIWLDKNNAVFK